MSAERKPHPYAEILRAIADGNQVQKAFSASEWIDVAASDALYAIAHESCPPGNFRIKPRVIIVNGVEVPEPVREPLKLGQKYWAVNINHGPDPENVEWRGGVIDLGSLNLGLIHLTEEAAQLHIEAMLKPSRRGVA